ncbi:MAG TPA: hypothetical protein VK308_08705 [Pyrinomonadaceae bacterium]|nr:hypothetical protein [Pyrinomonadaceae bacterium]
MTFNWFLFSFLSVAETQKIEIPEFFLWLSIPAAIVGFIALLIVIIKLLKMLGESEICRVPFREKSEVEITALGNLNICLEVPGFSAPAGGGFDYKLVKQNNGQEIELLPTITTFIGGRSSGLTKTFPVRVLQIEETGKYLLEVSGFKPQTDYSRYSLFISRPTVVRSFSYIFAIIFTGALFIGGFIFSLIALSSNK